MTDPIRAPAHVPLVVGPTRLHRAEWVAVDWVSALLPWIEATAGATVQGVASHPAPPGRTGEVMVKFYRLRKKDGFLRRLRTSRALLEAAGYRAFQQHGLAVPELVLWGETRRWGLFELGVVVTTRVPAISVADEFASTGRIELLQATAEQLGTIHRAGLAHGDPYTRNFLATRPHPMPLDIASWSHFGRSSQLQDLIRFTCSIQKLTGDPALARDLLRHYEQHGRPLPGTVDDVIARADTYAKDRKIRP